MKAKKIIKRLVVIVMCFGFIAALFGCKNKEKYILDGPNMENPFAWDSFNVSRSDSYAQHNFHIIVKYSEGGYIVRGTLRDDVGTEYEEEEGILLPKSACKKIDALQPGLLPDVGNSAENVLDELEDEELILLDAPTVDIEVAYINGTLLPKVDADNFSINVYEIVWPYFKDKYN